jgi:hypothetical protein
MNYEEFVRTVDQTSSNFNWRRGQALMNVLYTIWPEKYEAITETENDPYYMDDIVLKTLDILKNNWNPTRN